MIERQVQPPQSSAGSKSTSVCDRIAAAVQLGQRRQEGQSADLVQVTKLKKQYTSFMIGRITANSV